ncbi:MAG TPA: ATP-binding protein [Kofleriaceae bacterium]|jgi:hypothetical protein
MGSPVRRALCVARDAQVGRSAAAVLAAAGLTVESHDSLPASVPPGAALVVVDRAARVAAGEALRDVGAPVVVVGDDLADDALVALMLDAPVSHHVADPSGADLAITTRKLASGDLFGLEQYLAPNTGVGERVVSTDAARKQVVDEVVAWAEALGARRPVAVRLASALDELVMNALHDTPASGPRHAVVRWGADASHFAVSVADAFGALRQRDVIDHVLRARASRGAPAPSAASDGAGLGLYLVLANVAALIVNVEAGRRTEVVCLFDRATRDAPAVAAPRSLHVFT